ncbi:MAG: class I SAM-dependent methyltransferase [Ruthenibacterium lactatiformans]
MELTIRADVSTHMRELKQWLAQTRDEPAEDMNGFFAARVDTYEAHMSVWDKAYGRVAELTPGDCGPLLDLGCGTGLELDRIFARWPELAVTGVDLCAAMLEKLRAKHAGRQLELRCADYLAMDLGAEQYGAVVSVESLHHFTPEQKLELYKNSCRPAARQLSGRTTSPAARKRRLCCGRKARRRARANIPADVFIHFDTPLTLEHELALLRAAGFRAARPWTASREPRSCAAANKTGNRKALQRVKSCKPCSGCARRTP